MAQLPGNVRKRGQLSLYVKSPERVQLLDRVIQSRPKERSLSDALFSFLAEAIELSPLMAEERHELRRLEDYLLGARDALSGQTSADVRRNVYRRAISQYVLRHLASLSHAKAVFSAELTDEERRILQTFQEKGLLWAGSEETKEAEALWLATIHQTEKIVANRVEETYRRSVSPTASCEEK